MQRDFAAASAASQHRLEIGPHDVLYAVDSIIVPELVDGGTSGTQAVAQGFDSHIEPHIAPIFEIR